MVSTPPATTQSAPSLRIVVGGHGDGLQARGAEAVDGHAGGGDRQAGQQGRLAADVAGAVGAVAEIEVLDVVLVEPGALDGVLDGVGGHGHGGVMLNPPRPDLARPVRA